MANPLKPKVVEDINPGRGGALGRPGRASPPAGRGDAFSKLPPRLNLKYQSQVRIPLTKCVQYGIYIAAAFSLLLGSATAPTRLIQASSTSTASGDSNDRQALEVQLTQLEGQINQYEDQVTGYQKQGKSLKGEINILNGKIAKLNLQIQAINLTLSQLNRNIADTQSQIVADESDITVKKASLGKLLQKLYANGKAPLIEIFLQNPRFSDFFTDLNNITILQSNLRVAVEKITDLRDQLQEKQQQLRLAKSDAESVQAYQAAQKNQVASVKDQKNQLLSVTKGQESKYQTLLAQTKETAAQIRSRIFQLLGGGQLSFEDAYQYAKLAGSATGVEPSFILAVLDRESALGQNVGQCSYKTAMSPSNQALFLQIALELSLNPDLMTVSCPNRDGAYGGAMGPAQFIPSTWNLYKDRVGQVTGHKPSSPWNNADAFVATALYLRDGMQGCVAIYTTAASQQRCTAAKYYAGSRWRSYLWTYGEAVVSQAKSFQDDINTITG